MQLLLLDVGVSFGALPWQWDTSQSNVTVIGKDIIERTMCDAAKRISFVDTSLCGIHVAVSVQAAMMYVARAGRWQKLRLQIYRQRFSSLSRMAFELLAQSRWLSGDGGPGSTLVNLTAEGMRMEGPHDCLGWYHEEAGVFGYDEVDDADQSPSVHWHRGASADVGSVVEFPGGSSRRVYSVSLLVEAFAQRTDLGIAASGDAFYDPDVNENQSEVVKANSAGRLRLNAGEFDESPQKDYSLAWQSALDASGMFEMVSVASHLDPEWLRRTNLLSDFPLKIKLLGFDRKEVNANRDSASWNHLFKMSLLHEHVSKLPAEKVVFYLDLFDVVWLDCSRDLLKAFQRFGRPLVFSAEVSPFPITNQSIHRLPAGYPTLFGRQRREIGITSLRRRSARHRKAGLHKYRYLNSGCFVGYAGALQTALSRMISNGYDNEYVMRTPLGKSPEERTAMGAGLLDQLAWHTYAMKHPTEIALDYGAELCLNILGFDLADFELHGRSVWARPFERDVCFAHGNGASNVATYLREAQQLGVQPSLCHESVQHVETSPLEPLMKIHHLSCPRQ